jgi:uncharacterized protein
VKPLCIYHGNCADGFTSAWVVDRFFAGEVELYAGTYQQPPPDPKGRPVIMVDFSYKRDVLLEFAAKSAGVLLLDHHKSAAEDISGDGRITDLGEWTGRIDWARIDENFAQDVMEGCAGRVYALFDMERSGAGITWDFFFPQVPRPALISHVEDRDLWRFALPGTREIQANVFSYPYDLRAWSELAEADPARLVEEGRAIERKHFKDIAELLRVVTRRMVIAGHSVPVANLPYTLVSDAAHELAKGQPFAACYWDTPKGRVFGLRSADDGVDVSEVAKQYGGGGHRNAAGFTVPYSVALSFEEPPDGR